MIYKITIYDHKQRKGYFEYVEDEEVGEDRWIPYTKVLNNDWLYGWLECLGQSDSCPYFVMMANKEDLSVEVENIVV